ncbi:pyridoxal phosphate-dependent class II aminotransferase [Pontibacter diazotrophicus]|uniref:Pyridoxal phosphate-dependent class II aminotransferase n=1 Tax=Pontibacter diazotrophicus TaxID=1400979 RepID=A0A3D8L1U0_9BACT|nr:aminotransferase class I/II-fold pyridoxal phosphate-dependent enzyme [Pontibacter diazotrophicus]RDV11335.1 pyridoxal phosphate-dependent class II aminotransferase [Pontibacter diazotrophicus]
MLHGHGDDAYRYKHEIRADFSTNVWYGGEPAGLKEHLFSQWHLVQKYPEVLAESLSEQVAQHYHLKPAQVLISNGTTESIYLVAQAFRGKRTTIATPAFAEYEDACRMHQHQVAFMPWDELYNIPKLETDLLFICNPNNPTGSVFFPLEALIAGNPQTLFVLDEAFIEFTLSIETAVPLLSRYENLLILRSMTKAFTIPGLRLGYIAAHEKRIDRLRDHKFPWSVNALAIEAGKFIFDNYELLQLPVWQLLKDKEAFATQLQLTGVKVHDSHTHFFLAETAQGTAAELKQYLVEQHGILIRDASNFRDLNETHFRVATLAPAQNQVLIQALTTWNKHCS